MPDTLSYAVPADAIRVFAGFRRADLPPDRFLKDLGQTFMPGTPYMLQPLGLAAYLPAVIQEESDSQLPHEAALIAWPSPAAQQAGTRATLRGRMYTQSHAGVYAPSSSATFPVPIENFNPGTNGSLYLFGGATDWQSGSYSLFAAQKKDGQMPGNVFRNSIRQVLLANKALLSDNGVDQCIALAAENFVLVWSHYSAEKRDPHLLWESMTELVRPTIHVLGSRLICRDEPPAVELTGSSVALNYIFLRSAASFLK